MATNTEGTPPATDASTTNSDATSEDTADIKDIKKLMTETKVEGGKSAWAMTLETFGMYDGKKKKGDIITDNFDEAFQKIQELAEPKDWTFPLTPFADFNATKEELLKAFVHWSKKGDDGDTRYNPSKAMRRLEAYVEWMAKNCAEMDLKGTSMKEAADAWKMQVTHDEQGRLVWWIDLAALDLKFIKANVSPQDTLRYFVWLSHLVLFDKGKGFTLLCYR